MEKYLGAYGAEQICRAYHWHEVLDPTLDLTKELHYRQFRAIMNEHARFMARHNSIDHRRMLQQMYKLDE